MTNVQKVIKYCAIAFAVLLIVGIISTVVKGLAFLVNVFGDDEPISVADLKDYKIKDISELYIDIEVSDIEVVSGEEFSLNSNHEYLKLSQSSGKLSITETRDSWELFGEKYKVMLTIPENVTLKSVTVEAGAGKVLLENFKTEDLILELGAGEVTLNKVTVTEKTEFEGGAGAITVSACSFTNLDMNIGVGNCDLTAWVYGDSSVECGVGNADLTFYKSAEHDYEVSVSKGLGSVTVDGKSVSDGEKIGNGKNELDIECGVGDVDIKFAEK